ncbi:MAG TPA: glycoside hydrolase family 15 protein [Candidatus Tectomicrobia bacterium]|nr:glycoside hydrolase family 15 protein [Candidatus Tectomicrobia bacterium]
MDRRRPYPPLREYGAIGDGRTVGLVALDGSIDWLCLPDLDSPSVFAALLDAERGGCFALHPRLPYQARRRYLPDTNVLETTFTTATGVVRVTDVMTLPGRALAPSRELVRRVEGLSGHVAMTWRVEPRFGYGSAPVRLGRRGSYPVATSGNDAVAMCAWDAGPAQCDASGIGADPEIREGARATIAMVAAHGEPLVFPRRDEAEARAADTAAFWRRWAVDLTYAGPWRDAVVRSALALKLLVFAPSGAIAAAPTTSLPEAPGGERNWDYRYSWIRDASFTIEALLQLGKRAEATAFFWWFMHATRLTLPRLHALYRLDGGADAPERTLALDGYRGARPVRVGNGAAGQLQLDTYGELLDAAFVYANAGHRLDRDTGRDLASVADFVCRRWREPDSGIWEVRARPRHHTQSKAMCWVALDRAVRLARMGGLPVEHTGRWRAEAAAVRRFIDEQCWSEAKRSYVWYAGSEDLDASLLLMAIMRYEPPGSPRLQSTIEAIRRELASGPLLYRYTGDDGIAGGEGAFVCCSFWLAEALAIAGRREEATALFEELLRLANDLGLYAEEIMPRTGEFLGNFPQGLVHLALISAAMTMARP